ncbi:MAG: DUF3306 domain-containing protein, partial [Pseudolabrys sp.]|nr:DUF3306 domain-containing protein [Pseudolabrys sp.]
IRDFVGLQENDWDFNKPGAIAGFGPILPEHKVGEMVARLFGEVAKPEADPDLADDMQTPPSSAVSTTSTETSEAVAAAPDATVEHETKSATSNEPTVAVQHDAADARRHGGALPQVNRKS